MMLISLVDSLRRIFVIKPVIPYSCCFKYFMKIVDCCLIDFMHLPNLHTTRGLLLKCRHHGVGKCLSLSVDYNNSYCHSCSIEYKIGLRLVCKEVCH